MTTIPRRTGRSDDRGDRRTTTRRTFLSCTPAFVALAAGGWGCTGAEPMLQGSGATFPAPLYKRWFLEYYQQHGTTRVNYSPIGSGAGIRQFTAGLVSFGASDAGISKKEVDKLPSDYEGVLALPMTAGCIVLSYNLPGVSTPIRLSRAVYVSIFLREITRWDDERIARDIGTRRIEELMQQLKRRFTIAIVTHNLQQARRVSDKTAFLNVDDLANGSRTGYLVEFGDTRQIFEAPRNEQTQKYVSGEFG